VIATLKRQFDGFESTRLNLLEELKKLSAQQLSFKPDEDHWNILEVVHHLILVEQSFLRQTSPDYDIYSKKIRYPPWIGTSIVWIVFTFGFRVKMPAKGVAPSGTMALDELIPQWEQKRAELRNFLETIPAEKMNEPAFLHPISGRLTPKSGMNVFTKHLQHHVRQIRRIQNSARFPKA
jgi:hypothetical protein